MDSEHVLKHMPVLVKDADDPTTVVMQLIENLHRHDLNPLDEARAIAQLIDGHGMTHDAIADALRKSRTHIFESIRLLHLCPQALAAIEAGTLTRSVALLVAQRPTHKLQIEYTQKVLTSGPDGAPLSYRSAKDLAQRNYMTDLAQAPFSLTDAGLIVKAGPCTQCPKRTGAAPELWDKAGADICTDTSCFSDKKEVHYEHIKAQAQAMGHTIISGSQARALRTCSLSSREPRKCPFGMGCKARCAAHSLSYGQVPQRRRPPEGAFARPRMDSEHVLLPTEGANPAGYLLLDKPAKAGSQSLRLQLGNNLPQHQVVLIEAPGGAMVAALPVHAAVAARQAQANGSVASPPTLQELMQEYQQRWRSAALQAVTTALRSQAAAQPLDELPEEIAYYVILNIARGTASDRLHSIFDLRPGFDNVALRDAVRHAAKQPPHVQHMVLTLLVASSDGIVQPAPQADQAPQLEAAARIAQVDMAAVKTQVQRQMKDEAAARAAPADRAKPQLKTKIKTTKEQALHGISQAMHAVCDTQASAAAEKAGA